MRGATKSEFLTVAHSTCSDKKSHCIVRLSKEAAKISPLHMIVVIKQRKRQISVISEHILSVYNIFNIPLSIRAVVIFLGIILTSTVKGSIHEGFEMGGKL